MGGLCDVNPLLTSLHFLVILKNRNTLGIPARTPLEITSIPHLLETSIKMLFMGHRQESRRKFFESLHQESKKYAGIPSGYGLGNDDPLFQLYSRKKLGPREYKDEEISYDSARL